MTTDITKNGAVGDGLTLCTAAIQSAIDAVHQARALTRALTSCRNRFPGIGGFIIWMGHDSFPCLANTSILDFHGRMKSAAKAIQAVLQSTR